MQTRGRGRAAGFSAIELAVSIAIIIVFVAVLLDRMLYYEEAAEKADMEYTANVLRSALLIQWGTLMAEGRTGDYHKLLEQNPVGWLEQPLKNYAGELIAGDPSWLRQGSWYYDARYAELVYLVNSGHYFHPDASGLKRVRFKVQAVWGPGPEGKQNIISLHFAPVEPYRWF